MHHRTLIAQRHGATVPVSAYLIAGHRLDVRLGRSRDWLIRHNPAVMAIVLVAVGALFITEALGILLN